MCMLLVLRQLMIHVSVCQQLNQLSISYIRFLSNIAL